MMQKLATITLALLVAGAAHAVSYGFECITNNGAASAAIGEAQLGVDVNFEDGRALFEFTNIGTAQCSIAEIYFYDGTLFAQDSGAITETYGTVQFSLTDVHPAQLPGVNAVASSAFVIEAADAGNKAPTKGVNPGESLTISIALLQGVTPQAVLDALDTTDRDTFFIGLHVISFANGKSESFVTRDPPPTPVPEPCTLALMGLGSLLGLGGLRLRRKQ